VVSSLAGLRRRAAWAAWAALAALAVLPAWLVLDTPDAAPAAAPGPHPAAHGEPAAARRAAPRTGLCPDTARACVDTGRRQSWLQHDGRITLGPVPAMPGTGAAPDSVDTPHGVFRVAWKDADHTSGEFGDPMPHSVFFAPGGIAFHEGDLETPSHGCVHLSARDAALYFAALPVGAEVAVF